MTQQSWCLDDASGFRGWFATREEAEAAKKADPIFCANMDVIDEREWKRRRKATAKIEADVAAFNDRMYPGWTGVP
jgi:hypothetical protein